MNKELYERVIKNEEREADGYFYSYELLERRGKNIANFGLHLYSIRVKMSGGDTPIKIGEAKDIFSSKRKALDFFERIVDNLATPIDLKYVIEDEITV